eukprot:6263488-Amphidinium_carterae.1
MNLTSHLLQQHQPFHFPWRIWPSLIRVYTASSPSSDGNPNRVDSIPDDGIVLQLVVAYTPGGRRHAHPSSVVADHADLHPWGETARSSPSRV